MQSWRQCEVFFDLYPTAVFDKKSSVEYGKLRKILSSNGIIIGPNDMMIAATVLANDGTLITHNVEEFSRVEGLLIEDWTTEYPAK
ncbi:type II toxin-antitoxin system VapC family toxin [Treponema socranskii]|uniref:type II toxin-antitoxin system VapC family toxin n=1 Tax=Treponema socranskii TaxID=53419 RepID=UPI003D8DFB96